MYPKSVHPNMVIGLERPSKGKAKERSDGSRIEPEIEVIARPVNKEMLKSDRAPLTRPVSKSGDRGIEDRSAIRKDGCKRR